MHTLSILSFLYDYIKVILLSGRKAESLQKGKEEGSQTSSGWCWSWWRCWCRHGCCHGLFRIWYIKEI